MLLRNLPTFASGVPTRFRDAERARRTTSRTRRSLSLCVTIGRDWNFDRASGKLVISTYAVHGVIGLPRAHAAPASIITHGRSFDSGVTITSNSLQRNSASRMVGSQGVPPGMSRDARNTLI